MAAADPKAVAHAAHHMGVQDPVVVEYHTDEEPEGFYRREASHHLIGVSAQLSPRAMSQTIYHELAHARQCEVDYDGDASAFHDAVEAAASAAIGRGGMSPFEAEPIIAEELDDEVRLAHNNGGGYR